MTKSNEQDTSAPGQTPKVIPCPTCRRSTTYGPSNPYRPFCSPACKNADILAWADEEYRLPGQPADPDEVLEEVKKQQRDEE